jgi:queuine/archaeosine tRNA-ribosyltransferase
MRLVILHPALTLQEKYKVEELEIKMIILNTEVIHLDKPLLKERNQKGGILKAAQLQQGIAHLKE